MEKVIPKYPSVHRPATTFPSPLPHSHTINLQVNFPYGQVVIPPTLPTKKSTLLNFLCCISLQGTFPYALNLPKS